MARRPHRLERAHVIAGHFGFAAMVKSRAPRVPLSMLMLATVWLDVVFVPLLLAGIERIDPVPGTHGGYGEGVIHAHWTHSLLSAVVLAAAFGALSALRWGRESGAILGFVVFSHWLLDLPVHRGDMPLTPWTPELLGFGLWRVPAAAAVVELALVIAGALLYLRTATAHDPKRGRVAGVAVLVVGVLTLALNLLGL